MRESFGLGGVTRLATESVQRRGKESIASLTKRLAGSGKAAPAYLETTSTTLRKVSTTSLFILLRVLAAEAVMTAESRLVTSEGWASEMMRLRRIKI